MSVSTQHTLLVIGNTKAEEARPIRAVLAELASGWTVVHATRVDDALRESNVAPSMIVVVQLWTDEFRQSDVRRLLERFGLVHWLCCYGVWCESDGRNRDVWPLAIRVPLRDAVHRINHARSLVEAGRPPIALTAGRDELFLFESDFDCRTELAGIRCAVDSPDRAVVDWLHVVVESCRGVVVAIDNIAESVPDVLIVDADPVTRGTLPHITNYARQFAVIAMMNLPYPALKRELSASGIVTTLSKLAPQDMLAAAIADAASGITERS